MNFKYLSTTVMLACVPFAFGLEEIISGSVQGNEMDSASVENVKNKSNEVTKKSQINQQKAEVIKDEYIGPFSIDDVDVLRDDSFMSVIEDVKKL